MEEYILNCSPTVMFDTLYLPGRHLDSYFKQQLGIRGMILCVFEVFQYLISFLQSYMNIEYLSSEGFKFQKLFSADTFCIGNISGDTFFCNKSCETIHLLRKHFVSEHQNLGNTFKKLFFQKHIFLLLMLILDKMVQSENNLAEAIIFNKYV